jgi:hypothetical protein
VDNSAILLLPLLCASILPLLEKPIDFPSLSPDIQQTTGIHQLWDTEKH